MEEISMDFDRKYADYVNEKGVAKIQSLERETGKLILAYYTPPAAAHLSQDHLAKLQQLEKELCVRLVAYEKH
jgi:hypothetical protein